MPKHATLDELGKVYPDQTNREHCWPVGIVVWTAENENPAGMMEFGTWVKVTLAPSITVYAWKRTA